MSVVDWLAESKRRYEYLPATEATRQSAGEFVRGGINTLRWKVGHRLLGNVAVETTLCGGGVRFLVEAQDDLRRARTGLREAPVIEWLLDSVGSGTTFWDVGSFHGHYAILAAAAGARVIAFEPYQQNQKRIQDNAALNQIAIDIRPIALSDFHGAATFTNPGRSPEFRLDAEGDTLVQTRRGDELSPWPDVVKVDVEGHECAVLDGMDQVLKQVDRIAIEVHFGVDPEDVATELRRSGLDVTEIETDRQQTYIGGIRR